ncbi:MAG: hypothetical protein ACRDRK_22860 [Pseudonocardia sp.]
MTAPEPAAVSRAGSSAGRATRWAIWLPGLAVALGAAVATAHGLYEVAHAARVPQVIAWLYPLITDGLALVAYTATARLSGSAARYAWSVVVLAAGLSGLAQAVFLASDSAVEASPALRFGVGAWPAIAAAIVAHLLYLLAVDAPPERSPEGVAPVAIQPDAVPVQSVTARPVQPSTPGPVQRPAPDAAQPVRPALAAAPDATAEPPVRRSGGSPAGERARAAATRHAHRHGRLPTVTELEAAAEVSRGTAHSVLKTLRAQPEPLRLITTPPATPTGTGPNPADHADDTDDPTIEEAAHR